MYKDFIVIAILVVLIGSAIAYIVKAKKNGAKCIGCPAGGTCSGKANEASGCGCGCSGHKEEHDCCGCHTEDK